MPLSQFDIDNAQAAINAVLAWANGGPDFVATMPNGRLVDSPSKVIADANLFKNAIAWPPGGTVTDASQTYTDGGIVYAPQPSQLPFTGSGSFPAAKMYVVQGILAAALADDTGAGLVGIKHSGTGAVNTTLSVLFNNLPIDAKAMFDLAGDGSTDDRTELFNADAEAGPNGDVWLTAGTYRVSSDITLTSQFHMANGAKFLVDVGIELTFNKLPSTGEGNVIFDRTQLGSIVWGPETGIKKIKWWVDIGESQANVHADIVAAWASCNPADIISWGNGTYDIGTNILTPPLKELDNRGESKGINGNCVITGSGNRTILTSVGSDVDDSAGTAFRDIDLVNTKIDGTTLLIQNGGIELERVLVIQTGTDPASRACQIVQMFAMGWKDVFLSGKGDYVWTINPDGTAGQVGCNVNHFDRIQINGNSDTADWGLLCTQHCRNNVFTNLDITQTNNGIDLVAANGNIFNCPNIESGTPGPGVAIREDSATHSFWNMGGSLSSGQSIVISPLSEFIPGDVVNHPRQLAEGTELEINKGIKFLATSTSSNINTLDFYEEGTFTAVVTPGGGSVGQSSNTGSYVRVGKKVDIYGVLVLNLITAPTGTLKVTGLPFTPASSNQNRCSMPIEATNLSSSAITSITATVQGSTDIHIQRFEAGIVNNDLGGMLTNTTQIFLGGSYIV